MSKSSAAKHVKTMTAKTRHLKLVRDAVELPAKPVLRLVTDAELVAHRNAAIERAARAAAPVTITFTVNADVAPALRSAIEEMSDMVATRLEGPRPFKYEDALTCAAQALGQLRAAVYRAVPTADDRWAA